MQNEISADHQAIFNLGDMVTLANKHVTDSTDREIMSETHLRLNSPALLAQFLMQNMSSPMADCDAFGEDEKVFWTLIAFEMGPDWIAKFRRIGAFMAAVNKA